jgi:hypothetical protein
VLATEKNYFCDANSSEKNILLKTPITQISFCNLTLLTAKSQKCVPIILCPAAPPNIATKTELHPNPPSNIADKQKARITRAQYY